MHRLALALALLGAMTLPGCLDALNNPFAAPEFHVDAVHDEVYSFSYAGILDPENPPSDPESAYQRSTDTFQVPEGTVGLIFDYAVTFQAPGDQDLPQEFQEVQITLEGPGPGEGGNARLVTEGSGSWYFEDPTSGSWSLTWQARGQGSLFTLALATVEGEGADTTSLR